MALGVGSRTAPLCGAVREVSREDRNVRTQGGHSVLQRRATPVVGVLGVVGIGLMGVIVLPLGIRRNSDFDMLLFGSFLLVAMRGIWRALVRPRVILHDDHLEVVDLFWRWHVALGSIRSLGSENGLMIFLKNGRAVSVFAFSASIVDRGRTCEAAAHQIRRAMTRRRRSGSEDQTVRRDIDFAWMDIVIVPFFVLLVSAFFVGG